MALFKKIKYNYTTIILSLDHVKRLKLKKLSDLNITYKYIYFIGLTFLLKKINNY